MYLFLVFILWPYSGTFKIYIKFNNQHIFFVNHYFVAKVDSQAEKNPHNILNFNSFIFHYKRLHYQCI